MALRRFPRNEMHINLKLSVRLRKPIDELATSIIGDLSALLNNEELSDFQFIVGAKIFPVHKAIIAGKFTRSKT